jgi:hypothetical protein
MLPVWLGILIFFTVAGLLIASQLYWFRRARRLVASRPASWQRWLLGVPVYAWFGFLLLLLALVPLRWILFSLLGNPPVLFSLFQMFRAPALMIPVGLWVWASMLAFLAVMAVKAAAWVYDRLRRAVPAGGGAGKPSVVSPERRHFLQTATYAAGALPVVAIGYGFLIGRKNYRVEEVTLRFAELPAGLDGLRLVLLTDVHASAYMPVKEIRRVVGLARELNADLVFHTGDFTTSRGDPLEEAVAELVRVEGRYGAFGCLGNHEIYAGTEQAATELFARGPSTLARDGPSTVAQGGERESNHERKSNHGVRILRQQNAELEVGGAKLNLIGVDYQRQPRILDPEQWRPHFLRGVEKLVRPDAFNILLTHNPNPFVRAAELGIELSLAGHTHGGQIQVEILNSRWSAPRFFTPFVSGLYDLPVPADKAQGTKHAFLYVSRGLGTIALPVRLSAPPEITLLSLRRG